MSKNNVELQIKAVFQKEGVECSEHEISRAVDFMKAVNVPAKEAALAVAKCIKRNSARDAALGIIRFSEQINDDHNDTPILENFLRRRTLSVVYGEQGAGKTPFVFSLAANLALGHLIGERQTAAHTSGVWNGRLKVVYLIKQDQENVKWLVQELARSADVTESELEQTFICVDAEKSGLTLNSSGADWDKFLSILAGDGFGKPDLIVIDPLHEFMTGNEVDNQTWQAPGARLKEIRNKTGAHVMAVHHANASGGLRGHGDARSIFDEHIRITSSGAGTKAPARRLVASFTRSRSGFIGQQIVATTRKVSAGFGVVADFKSKPDGVDKKIQENRLNKPEDTPETALEKGVYAEATEYVFKTTQITDVEALTKATEKHLEAKHDGLKVRFNQRRYIKEAARRLTKKH